MTFTIESGREMRSAEVAAVLGISIRSVEIYVRRGHLTPRKCPISRRVWHDPEQVRQLAEKMKPAR